MHRELIRARQHAVQFDVVYEQTVVVMVIIRVDDEVVRVGGVSRDGRDARVAVVDGNRCVTRFGDEPREVSLLVQRT